jgi:hypothetical protein
MDAFEKGVASYLDTELMSKLPENTFQRVIAGTAISLAIKKSEPILSNLRNNSFVKMIEIFDEKGNVDIDLLRDEVKKQIPESGVKADFPMIGTMTFHQNDVDKLYNHIIAKS